LDSVREWICEHGDYSDFEYCFTGILHGDADELELQKNVLHLQLNLQNKVFGTSLILIVDVDK
jgi:hypothetical protein